MDVFSTALNHAKAVTQLELSYGIILTNKKTIRSRPHPIRLPYVAVIKPTQAKLDQTKLSRLE